MDCPVWRAKPTPAACAAAALGAGLCACLSAFAECRLLQRAELPVNASRNRPVIPGTIDGQAVKILADTGAQTSFVTHAAAKRLMLTELSTSGSTRGIGGEAYLYRTSVKQLMLDRLSVGRLTLPVVEITGSPDFDMILGENFFSHWAVEFDLAHSAIRLFEPKDCHVEQLVYWSKTYSLAELIASPADSSRIETTVLLNGNAVRAILDTGAMFSVVSPAAAASAGVTLDSTNVRFVGKLHGVGRNAIDSWIGTFGSFTIGDETIRNAKLLISDMNKSNEVMTIRSRIPVPVSMPPMLIGADFFLAHRMLIDGPDRKMVFTYLGGPVFDTLHLHPLDPDAAGSNDRPPSEAPTSSPR